MNLISNKKIITTLLGIVALGLHLGMALWGTDHKGLLVTAHPMVIALPAVTALACLNATSVLSNRKIFGRYEKKSAPPAETAIGCFALAGGITIATVSSLGSWLRLEQIRSICGVFAVLALITVGLKRFSGKQPSFLFHGLVCIYLTLHTVSHYQIWSSSPQLLHWFFPMAASVLLMLFSYQQTAFDVDLGNCRMQIFTGLLAAFFCLGAVPMENGMFYLGGALWTLTNLCTYEKENSE